MTPEIRLLGQVGVAVAGSDALRWRLGSPRAQVALAVLTMERDGGVPRDVLAEAIWADRLPTTWRPALRGVVKVVRDFLSTALSDCAEPVVADAGRYMLRIPQRTRVDIEVAADAITSARRALDAGEPDEARQRASEAVVLLRRPFLPEHDGDWVSALRSRLVEQLMTALELSSHIALARGDPAAALAAADEAVARAPLRESAYRCRMAAHAAAGNRSEALGAYQRLRALLARELGADPAPETDAAYLDLLGPPPSPRPDGGGSPPSGQGGLPTFVGRRTELARLSDAWDAATRGTGQLVILTGAPGIGKTRLATEIARHAMAQSGLVLFARCDRVPTVPYQPFVEMLDGHLHELGRSDLPQLSARAWSTLEAVFPSLVSSPAEPDPRRTAADRPALADAVASVLRWAAADRPALALIDDLDRADRDTLLLVEQILVRTADCRLMAIAVARDVPDRTGALVDTLAAGWETSTLHRIRLGPLAPAAVRSLADELAGPGDHGTPAIARLLVDTGGNPRLLSQLLRSPDSESDAHSVLARSDLQRHAVSMLDTFDALDASTANLVRASSTGAALVDLDLLRRVAGLSGDEALDALDAALAAGILVEVAADQAPPRYRFAHDVVRRAVRSRLSRARRRWLHGRWADAIEAVYGESLDAYVRDLAEHRLAAADPGGDHRAVDWARRAARQAEERRAPGDATVLRRQALGCVPPGDVELRAELAAELGIAQADAGDHDGGQTLLDSIVLARACGRVDVAAKAALRLAELARTSPAIRAEALASVQQTVSACRAGATRAGVDGLVLAQLVARLVELRGREQVEAAELTVAIGRLCRHLSALGGPGPLADRERLARDLSTLAAAANDATGCLTAGHHTAMVAAITGDETAKQRALQSMVAGDAAGQPGGQVLLTEHDVGLAVREGRFDDAEAAAKTLADHRLAGSVGSVGAVAVEPVPGSMAPRQVMIADWLQGVVRDQPVGPSDAPESIRAAEDVLVALLAGDRGTARLGARALANRAGSLPVDDAWLHTMALLAIAAVELNDRPTADAASALLAPHSELTCGVGYRTFVGPVTLHLGRLAMVTGDLAQAEHQLSTALGQLASVRARPWIALAQKSMAAVLAARGRSSDWTSIKALHREATSAAHQLGLRPLLDS